MSLWQTLKRLLLSWFDKASTPSTLPILPTSATPPISPQASSDYEKIYVEHLQHLYGDIKGFFIPRSIAPKLEEIFIEPHLIRLSADSVTRQEHSFHHADHHSSSIWQWMNKFNAFWITGRPGSGKTTLLFHMILTLNERLSEMLASPEQPIRDELPILLYLRNHRREINDNPTYTLAQAAHNALMIHQINNPLPVDWFSVQLKKGRCLVMMDGLDEVPETQREGVARWIEQQIRAYNNNHFIVTSRLLDPALLRDVTVLKIESFTNQQMQHFVKRWYLACERQGHMAGMAAQEQANVLITLLSKPASNMLASNPLLLTMMLSYHCHPERQADLSTPVQLPRRRADLYAKVCDVALNEPVSSFETSREGTTGHTSVKQKLDLLQPLAYQMMKHHRSSLHLDEARKVLYVPLDLITGNPNVADFLQGIEQQSGLLHKNGEYAFIQRTFQEYMTALYIAEQGLEKELMNAVRFEDSWWHETTYFYSTYTDATPIMIAFLRHEKLSVPMLRLAIDCMKQPGEVELEVQNRWEKRLKENVEDPSPVRRRLVAQGLLSLRLKQLVPVDENRYVADSLITNAEYQLLCASRSKPQAASWRSRQAASSEGSFAAGSGLEPVFGVQPADAVAFCQWLTEQDREGWHYRLPTLGEFSPLLSEIGYWVFSETEQVYKNQHQANQQISLPVLEDQLRFALAYDLANNGNLARESLLAFSYDLEQADSPTRALALACDFTYERAHHYATNASSALTMSQPHSFEHTRLAKFVTERLLRLLRQDSSSGSSIKQSGKQAKTKYTSDTTLAEQYFTLHRELQRIQKQINNPSPASGGIRIVAYRPVEARQAPIAQNKSRRRKTKARSMPKTTRQQISPASSARKQTRIIQKKICILGNPNVGKTSLLRRFVEGHFDERYLSTVGVNILRKTLKRPTYTMKMVLWEIEGGHGFKKAHIEYLHGVTGAIIVCDLTCQKTLAGIEQYADQLRALNSSALFVIVGNKVDLAKHRAITYEQLNAVSKKLGCPYILTSAKTGTQVNDAFSLLADQIEEASS